MQLTLKPKRIEVSQEEVDFLKKLNKVNYLWGFSEGDVSDSVVGKGLATEDGDGRVEINRDGLEVLEILGSLRE